MTHFRDIQFSRSDPQIWPYMKIPDFTFSRKYLSCGLNFEISAYPQKPKTTYLPSKYEVYRTQTHEMRAISKRAFLFSGHGRDAVNGMRFFSSKF